MQNLNKEEKTALIIQKLREGMDITEAEKDVKRDMEYVRELNRKKKQMEGEVKRMNQKIEKQRETFKKEFQKLKDKQQKLDEEPTKRIYGRNANTKQIKRVINYLKENPESAVTKISHEICSTTTITADALRFLVGLGIVSEKKSANCIKQYTLIKNDK